MARYDAIRRETTRYERDARLLFVTSKRSFHEKYVDLVLRRGLRPLKHCPPRHTMPKREHRDDVPLMLYIWRSRQVDPRRQTWMRDGIWSEADLSTLFFFVSERNLYLQ